MIESVNHEIESGEAEKLLTIIDRSQDLVAKISESLDQLITKHGLSSGLLDQLRDLPEIEFSAKEKDTKRMKGLVEGMDLEGALPKQVIPKGTIIAQFVGIYGIGNFFTPVDPDTGRMATPEELGIAAVKKVDGMDEPQPKIVSYFCRPRRHYCDAKHRQGM